MQCCIVLYDHDDKAVRALDGDDGFCLYHAALIVARLYERRLGARGR